MPPRKTIILIGAGNILSSVLIKEIQKSHGLDAIILSDEEAKEKGIIPKEEPKPYILRNPPQFELPEIFYDKHQAKNDCKKGWKNKHTWKK